MKQKVSTIDSGLVDIIHIKDGTVVRIDGELYVKGSINRFQAKYIAQAAGLNVDGQNYETLKDATVLVNLRDGAVDVVYPGKEGSIVTGNLVFTQ